MQIKHPPIPLHPYYEAKLQKYPPLRREDELALDINSPEDRLKLYHHNLRLIVSLANKHFKLQSNLRDELIAVGNIVMYNLIPHYIPSQGKFSSYIANPVKGAMSACIAEQGGFLTLKQKAFARMQEVSSIARDLEMQGLPADAASIASIIKKRREAEGNNRGVDLNTVKAHLFRASIHRAEALSPVNQNLILAPDQEAATNIDTKLLMQALALLLKTTKSKNPDKWLYILIKRFGLDGENPMTQEALAEVFWGQSHEAIRQNEVRALKELRLLMQVHGDEVKATEPLKITHEFCNRLLVQALAH